jgi:hypothetical protein
MRQRILIVLTGILMLAGIAAPAMAQSQQSTGHVVHSSAQRRCSRPYSYSDGVTGVANIAYAKAEWTGDPSGCGTYLQTRVRSSVSCGASNSGAVRGSGIWAQATGAQIYCSAWIRFKCASSACVWSTWQRLKNTNGKLT